MLKKIAIPIGILLSFWLYHACNSDIEPPKDQCKDSFSEYAARSYFENHAKWLNPLHFGHAEHEHPETRSSELSLLNLVPQWNKAVRSVSDIAEVVEIPVGSNSDLIASRKVYRKDSLRRMEIVRGERKLIIARRKTGQVQMFLVTLIPDRECVRKGDAPAAEFRYLGGSRFSGLVICSELDGRYGDIFRYKDGYQTKRLGIVHAGEEYRDVNGREYFRLKLEESVHLRTRTGSAEDPGEHNCSGPNCIVCNTQELEEVVVTPDPPCSNCGQRPCRCCFWCHAYPCICYNYCPHCFGDPCICLPPCPECGSRYCQGHHNGGGGGDTEPVPGGDQEPEPEQPATQPTIDCSNSSNSTVRTKTKQLIDSLNRIGRNTHGSKNYISFTDFLHSVDSFSAIENSTSWYHYEGKNLLTPVIHGTATHVEINWNSYIVSAVHNHVGNSPPSTLDVMTAARLAKESDQFESLLVYNTVDSSYYAVCIVDRAKATAFYNTHSSKLGSNQKYEPDSDIGDYFEHTSDDFSYFANDQLAFRHAAVFSEYDAGMKIVKWLPNGQTETYDVKKVPGKTYLTPIKCK